MALCPKCDEDYASLPEHTPLCDGTPRKAARSALSRGQSAATAPASSWRAQNPPPAPLPESVRNEMSPTHNVTHAWYFFPPVVDITGLSTTGLPQDVFHTSSSWQPHQRQMQEEQGSILVMPIERYGGTVGGSPYVHLLPVVDETWTHIVDLWRDAIPQELAVEHDLLEQAEHDLDRLSNDRGDRLVVRNRIRVLSTRIQQLEALDFDAVRGFFDQESRYSRLAARSSGQQQRDMIGDLITEEFERRVG